MFSGCRKQSANEKRYELRGKIISVNKLEQTVTIAHEEVAGYMPAMTMPFTIKDRAWLETLRAGDKIAATLVVDDLSLRLEDIVTVSEAVADPNAKSSDGVVEPKPGDQVPDFGLVNQDGKRIRISQYRGKAVVLTFIYTRCPDPNQCTLMSSNFAEIERELQKQPELYSKTHLLSVSFDPEYDTPKVLRSYGASTTGRFTDEQFQHWEFAGGTVDEVKGIAQYFGLRYYNDTESGEQKIIHALRTAVIAPDGRVVKLYRGNEWKPAEILKDLVTLFSPGTIKQ